MLWKSPYGYSKLCNINAQKKLIHCMAVFTILYGNYYLPHGEFGLIWIGKFARRTWVNFTQQYGKNRQRCQKNKFTMLYGNYCYIFIENFPQKFSPCRAQHRSYTRRVCECLLFLRSVLFDGISCLDQRSSFILSFTPSKILHSQFSRNRH